MVIMSVDLGKARTGLAVCDKTEFLASPYKVIFEKSPVKLPQKVAEAAKEAEAERMMAAEAVRIANYVKANGITETPTESGIYIIRQGGTSHKMILK